MNKPLEEGLAISLQVNGTARKVAFDPRGRLSDLLRDGLGLTGTKIGCHAGDCGACTVLLDGEQVCACLVAAGQCSDRDVITVEGLAEAGRLSALQQAFLVHGAAQCGICTPGMLVAATSLLDACRNPTEAQVLDALAGVLCRCTGYRKIVEAVMAVAGRGKAAAGDAGGPAGSGSDTGAADGLQAVGARLPRLDGVAKVTGAEQFGADRFPVGALWMRTVRSPHARARFAIDDLEEFMQDHPGIEAVVTAADVPNNRFAIFPELRDQPVLADGEVRFRGEAVLLLVGEKDAVMAVDASMLPIRWALRPALTACEAALAAAAIDPEEALHTRWPDNILCRGRVNTGDVEAALARLPAGSHRASLEVVTRHVEHAYIEPEAGYAVWQGERVHLFACTQTPYLDRDEVASVMGIDPARVRIEPSAIGGGFGGKLDLSVQPLLAVAAKKAGRAVRTVWDRPESMIATTKRHPARMTATAACSAEGDLLAYDFQGDFDTGAYSSWGPTVANRVPIHASGPYRVPNVRALTRAVLTNNPISGAFRGFGVPQSTVVGEALLDELAQSCGMDPLEFRYRNALRAGDRTPTGQRLDASVGLRLCLDRLRPAWSESRERARAFNDRAAAEGVPLRRGAGIACMWYGIGNTVMANPSTMTVGLRADGRFMLYNGAQEIGQGTYTIMAQIAAQALGVPVSLIDQIHGDTDATEDAGKSSASRQTFVSGNAARLAGLDLRAKLAAMGGLTDCAEEPAELPELFLDGRKLVIRGRDRREVELDLATIPADSRGDVAVGRGTFDPPTVPLDADGQGVPYATYGFAAQVAEVEVDLELGTVKPLHIHAAHDVGRAINPTLTEGQIHGGIAQGIGLALMEEYVSGRTDNLHDYLIPTAGDVPPITSWLVEDPEPLGPYGAKGVGEPALVATAPAVLNAVRMATGVRLTQLPATPSRVRAALLAARKVPADSDRSWSMGRAPGLNQSELGDAAPGPREADGQEDPARAQPVAEDPRLVVPKAPEKMAQNKIQCDACPVLCQISDGRLGACDRWGNVGGRLVRTDPVVLMRRPDIEVVPTGGGDGVLLSAVPQPNETGAGTLFVSGVASGTTYPDYKPAPFIVGSRHRGVDLVTVVTEGIFSYCSFKVKIDTDRYLGPEQATVRHKGEAVGHVTTIEYGSQFLSLGGVHHLTGGSRKEGRVTCELMMSLGNKQAAELTIEGGAVVTVQADRAPIINGVEERRMRVGCGSATIGIFARQWYDQVDEVVVVDDHITGVLTEHQAGRCLDMAPSGIRLRGRKSTPGRYFQVADPGTGWGGTSISDPLSIIESWDPKTARPGLRLLMVSTTGEDAEYFVLDDALVPRKAPMPEPVRRVVERIGENCEAALATVLFVGGAGGSLRAGVTDNPILLTRSIKSLLTRVTCGGAPAYIWPGGGITVMTDVSRMPDLSFGSVPTPAIVAPIEFTLRREDYRALGGHMDRIRTLADVTGGEPHRIIEWDGSNPWPLAGFT